MAKKNDHKVPPSFVTPWNEIIPESDRKGPVMLEIAVGPVAAEVILATGLIVPKGSRVSVRTSVIGNRRTAVDKLIQYADIRDDMRPGDVIAFGGKSRVSKGIKYWTRSSVSHVAAVYHMQQRVDEDSDADFDSYSHSHPYFNMMIESTQLGDANGVVVRQISKAIAEYDGDVWWLPLSEASRERFDEAKFSKWMFPQIGKEYDMPQAIKAGMDRLDWTGLTWADEDFSRLFCSELIAAALRKAGVLFMGVMGLNEQDLGVTLRQKQDLACPNASEETPIQLCQRPIFGTIAQLLGEPKELLS